MEELLKAAKPDQANSELIRMQREIEAGIPIQPYAAYPGNGAYKICFTSRDLKSIEKTKEYLGNRFVYAVHPYADSTSCFNGEIIPKGIDKGRGMELVCQYYGASMQDTIAFGDSMNDYEILQHCQLGIAMGNAVQQLKDVADDITDSVTDNGIYNSFIKYHLIEPK